MTGRYRPKRLVVVSEIDVSRRKVLAGILRDAREECTPPWEVQLDLRDLGRRDPTEIQSGGFSGIIAAIINAADRKRYFKTGLPTVLFEPTIAKVDRSRRPPNNITFFNDHCAEGRAAAEYFIERGFRSFAFVGTPSPIAWSEARRQGYAATLRKSGFRPLVYRAPRLDIPNDFTREAPALERWLKRLPRRTAILAAHDERAQQITIAARHAGISVPSDIALLGVDDDEIICSTASPSISSIHVPSEEEGWRFAKAMTDLLDGRNDVSVFRTCHTRIVTRLSTDAFAFNDPIVAKALAYAERHLSEPLRGETLAAAANCSLRTLQTKMLKMLGRTIRDELCHLRQTTALRLIRETRMPVADIAAQCGYCSASHLGTHMKRTFGQRPLEIRRSAQGERR